MTGREVIQKNEALLRAIIRTIDKNLDYSLIDGGEGLRFALKLTLRGREATVSVSIEDLRLAGENAVRKNAVRQKIKGVHDHMMDSHNPDVLGTKVARMLKGTREAQETFRRSPFQRSPRR
jgi:hypothetical protein